MDTRDCPVIIISEPDGKVVRNVLFDKETLYLGRGEQNDICLLDAEMKISREHLRILKKNDAVYVYDLNSFNGTFLNGKRIESDPICFKWNPHDEVQIGEYSLRIYTSMASAEEEMKREEISGGKTVPMNREKVFAEASSMRPFPSPSDISHGIPSDMELERKKEISGSSTERMQGPQKNEKESPAMTMSQWGLFGVLLVGAMSLWIWWAETKGQQEKKAEDPVLTKPDDSPAIVTTLKIESKAPKEGLFQGTGHVAEQRKVSIQSTVDGEVEEISVKAGEEIKAGQVLARLKQTNARLELERSQIELKMAGLSYEEAKSQLQEAEETFRRKQELYQKGLSSKIELDAARSKVASLTPRLEWYREKIASVHQQTRIAQMHLDDTVIRAPFDGIITEKFCEVGGVVYKQGKTQLFTLVDLRDIGAMVEIGESSISKIHKGQKVKLVLNAYPGRQYSGEVRRIMPIVNKQKGTVPVDIVFMDPNRHILPGMGVQAIFCRDEESPISSREPFLAAQASVYREKEEHFVWIVTSESKVEKRKVRLGKVVGENVEILDGVSAGEEIVISASGELKEGGKVSREIPKK